MMLATEWIAHLTNEGAWDEMNDLVTNDPQRAWRIIRAMIGSAADFGVLAALAAGPVERLIDRHGDSILPIIAADAQTNTRLRLCLQATYSEFPAELRALVEAETSDVRDLPPDEDALLGGKDLALAISWLRHSNASFAGQLLDEMTKDDPSGAWDVLRVLAMFADEDVRTRDDVFQGAFEPFIRRHFDDYHDQLVDLGRRVESFRKWADGQGKPLVDDAQKWAAFLAELASG